MTVIDFVIKNNVIGFFEDKLVFASGRQSHWYSNWRNVFSNTELLNEAADYVLSFAREKDLKPDLFVGVKEGATLLGLMVQMKWSKVIGNNLLVIERGRPKDHGPANDKYFIGNPVGKKVVILEDTVTTGLSVLNSLTRFKEAGINVIAVICLVNRMAKRDNGKTVEDELLDLGVPFYYLSSAFDLLPKVVERLNPSDQIIEKIEQEFKDYGISEIHLPRRKG